ncbi:MAG TPA: hypothetical protein VD833_20215 [Vicinamibacterales bacterium]|nr:hypothetical protein [Vicinamibacterales bacterium]
MHGREAVLCVSIVVGAGCARPGEVHVAPDESKPHLSWEIRSGTGEGDGAFVCGSAQPGRPCVLAASTAESQTLAAVHLLAHAAAQPTSYLGFMRPTFLEGDTSRKLGELNVTVEPGSRPVGTTVLGRVTSEAGSYELIVSVDATQPGSPAPQHIPARVPVEVK